MEYFAKGLVGNAWQPMTTVNLSGSDIGLTIDRAAGVYMYPFFYTNSFFSSVLCTPVLFYVRSSSYR
jgi:hypothetical protein